MLREGLVTRVRFVGASLLAFAFMMVSVEPAQAIGIPLAGWAYSFSDKVLLNSARYPAPAYGFWGWVLDPSADILKGQVTFQYDPTVITILPEYSGFIGRFSDNPAIDIPIGDTSPFDVSQLPGPRPGMTWSLTVNPDTVTLAFDVSADPINLDEAAGSINFFVLATATSKDVTGWVEQTSGLGQFRELGSATDRSQTFALCSSPDRGEYYCGDPDASSYASHGFSPVMTPVPEPATLLLLGSGSAGFAILRKRRGVNRR